MARETEHDESKGSLLQLLSRLKERDYKFVTPTPATHARVVARPDKQKAHTVEDVLGWSLPFGDKLLPPDIETCLVDAGMLVADPLGRRSLVRVSWLAGNLYLHSSYPTNNEDAVFFGPDSYRFAALVTEELRRNPPTSNARIVDIGTGAGVGAVTAALLCPSAEVIMTDVNSDALRLARINAEAAGVEIQTAETCGLEGVEGLFDIAIINPPYIIDEGERAYRDGGGMNGGALSVELTRTALEHLRPGGRVILYTGSAIIRSQDALRDALTTMARNADATIDYKEADPDVFGEELSRPQYREVDRIALINCIIRRPRRAEPRDDGEARFGEPGRFGPAEPTHARSV
jgi:methylase of polypeptide subunit release factors